MKALLAAAAAVLLTAGAASAAPRYDSYHGKPGYSAGKVTVFERLAIARAKFRVATVERRANADGRVTPYERAQIRAAKADYATVVARARRT